MFAHLLFLIYLIILFLSIQFDTEGKKYFKTLNMVSLCATDPFPKAQLIWIILMKGLVPTSTKEVGWGVKLHQYTKIDLNHKDWKRGGV